jgi:hypothetical protein
METMLELHKNDIYNKIFVDRDIIHSVVKKDNYVLHKEIERRNGFIYMRMKKESIRTPISA